MRIGGALAAALDAPLPDYGARAQRALEPFTRRVADKVVAEELLPRLLG